MVDSFRSGGGKGKEYLGSLSRSGKGTRHRVRISLAPIRRRGREATSERASQHERIHRQRGSGSSDDDDDASNDAATESARTESRDSRDAPIRAALGATRPTCVHKNARRRPEPNKEASSSGEKDQYGRKNAVRPPIRFPLAPLDSRPSSPRGLGILYPTFIMPFYALFPATTAACTYVWTWYTWYTRGIRGRGYTLQRKRGKREREGELHSRWSLLFEARKESRDERTSRRLRRQRAASTKKNALEEEARRLRTSSPPPPCSLSTN
ncbi:hypothetical protein EAG_00851 [Camponotus floridanus]|uniref:Transmembrane protein n=1 Tax=Camponotus floridanus TaxID=104421 RepID=E2AQ87_CAMFO|nr:hypothetical protein EAG_00851 [Camponotus floridanus]